MAKLSRIYQKIFGSSGSTSDFNEIGSAAAGTPVTTKNLETIQSASNFLDGWAACILGNGSPMLEDMNAMDFLLTSQLAYLFQAGIPEWDDETTYYIGSIAQDGNGVAYISLIDTNLNQALTNTAAWKTFMPAPLNPQANALLSARNIGSWTGRTITPSTSILAFAICWSEEKSLFVLVGGSSDGHNVFTSPDGITWTERSTGVSNAFVAVCYSAELALFVAVGEYVIQTSPDGTTWTSRTVPTVGTLLEGVCWSPELGLFVAVSAATVGVITSPDGINWTNRTVSQLNQWNSVCWSADLNLFVAVADSGTNRVMTSPDGTTWTMRTAAAANGWQGVCWSKELGIFVAVSTDGTDRVMTSRDGITWTSRTAAEANQWDGVCWAPELGVFIAVASDGTNRIMTSRDGITWTARAQAQSNDLNGVCWSPQLGIAALVSTAGSTQVQTSKFVKKFICP